MKLIKKNLKTVKNKLLCELEDYLIDGFLPQMSSGAVLTPEAQEEIGAELMQNIMTAIKEKAVRFAIICYTDEDGKELTEDDLKEIPLKLKIFQECLPDIMEIMGEYIQEGDAEEGKPKIKPKKIHPRK